MESYTIIGAWASGNEQLDRSSKVARKRENWRVIIPVCTKLLLINVLNNVPSILIFDRWYAGIGGG